MGSVQLSSRRAVPGQRHPLEEAAGPVLAVEVATAADALVRIDQGLHLGDVGLDRGRARAPGPPRPGGGRRARSRGRRACRRRSAGATRRVAAPRRSAPSAAGCCREVGRNAAVEVAHLVDRADDLVERDHLHAQRRSPPAPERVDDLAGRRASRAVVAVLPRIRAASSDSVWWRRARRKSLSASTRGEPVSLTMAHVPPRALTAVGTGVMSISLPRDHVADRRRRRPDPVGHRLAVAGGCGRAGATRVQPLEDVVQRLDADVRPVLAVAQAERWRVGQQHVDRAGRGAARADPAHQPPGAPGGTRAGCTGAGPGCSARSRRARRSAARPRRPPARRRSRRRGGAALAGHARRAGTARTGAGGPGSTAGSWLPGTKTTGTSTEEAMYSR